MSKRPEGKRQAVLVIHGIGDQQPMTTLRGFVESVLDVGKNPEQPAYYSKPDTLSNNFDLRCLTTPGNTHPRTDFYELYWQHLMPKAGWSQIATWAWFLMYRRKKDVPPRLRGAWWILWIAASLFGLYTAASCLPAVVQHQESTTTLMSIPLGVVLVWVFLKAFFLSTVGDAAIYLIARPENVAARNAIRAAGVDLLDNLHKSGEYNRIIVVGHSLGSIIGYDILNTAWHRYYTRHGSPEHPRRELRHALEEAGTLAREIYDRQGRGQVISETMRQQWNELVLAVRAEMRSSNHGWLVSDFITLGSPLAHADLLLARNREELRWKMHQREFPCSPPVVDSRGSLSVKIDYMLPSNQQPRTTYVPYHAAWTACVRWSNLYFPCQWYLMGDFVAGPLEHLFGPGIIDLKVRTQRRGGLLAHTSYWHRDPRDQGVADAPVATLWRVLDLKIWRED